MTTPCLPDTSPSPSPCSPLLFLFLSLAYAMLWKRLKRIPLANGSVTRHVTTSDRRTGQGIGYALSENLRADRTAHTLWARRTRPSRIRRAKKHAATPAKVRVSRTPD